MNMATPLTQTRAVDFRNVTVRVKVKDSLTQPILEAIDLQLEKG